MNKIEVLDNIIELRHIKTLLSNFIDTPVGPDGRIHTSFSLVETGRLSSHEDELGEGTHLQNVPPKIRKMFIPDKGYILVEADKSQGEARIVAWLANELRMKEMFRSGGDIHKKNASYIFGIPESDIPGEDEIDGKKTKRYLAKRMVHASNYGMGTRTMATHLSITVKEAEEAQAKYFRAFPMILRWQKEVQEKLFKGRVLTNPFGRRRMFFDRLGPKLVREGLGFLGQSTLVDDVNRAMIQLFYLGEQRLQILHQGHDSILWQVRPEDLEWSIKLGRELLEQPFLCGEDMLTIPVEFKIGANWGEMEKRK